MPAIEPRGADLAPHAVVFFTNALLHERFRDGPAVVQRRAMFDPLPDLRARDLGGGGVFHQVVDRHSALTAEPRLEILDADANVVAEAGVGARTARRLDERGGVRGHV